MKARPSPFLSKSKYLTGLQCPKLLWYHYNAKDQFPPIDPETQSIFDQGHEVGNLAQSLFSEGIKVEEEIDFEKVVARSQSLIKERKPLFEAGFRYDNTYARVDILDPVDKNSWDIVEVKSGTSIKDINYYDIAFQKYCYEGAGLSIVKCYLMYINNEYMKNGPIDPRELFIKEDVTDAIKPYLDGIKERLKGMCDNIALKKCPDTKIGPHCDAPYECLLKPICWKFLPEKNPLTLYRFKKQTAFELINKGTTAILDLPDEFTLTDKQHIQRECIRSGKPFVDKRGIENFLIQLRRPLHFLDFETFGAAIPIYDNSRPYEQVPFQFSLHIWEAADREPVHYSYLADGKSDPRPEILAGLKKLIKENGSVIAFNSSFEIARLKECVAIHPEYNTWLDDIEERFVDLLVPFRAFHYYHPDQNGSASIKKLAPALTKDSYKDLEIGEGGMASSEYFRVTFGKGILGTERKRVYEALKKYCEIDTRVMVDIVKALNKIIT